jgi:hypothetical protein
LVEQVLALGLHGRLLLLLVFPVLTPAVAAAAVMVLVEVQQPAAAQELDHLEHQTMEQQILAAAVAVQEKPAAVMVHQAAQELLL